MNFKKIKSVLLVSVVCFSIVVTGCNKNSDSANSQRNSKSKEASNEDLLSNTTFEINVSKLLENKNSLIGDNTSSINIASNLPINANYNYEGIELKTKEKPYELIINFKELSENKRSIVLVDKTGKKISEELKMSSDDAFIKSSMIAFALMKNVDEVTMNFPFDKDSEAKVGSIELNKDGKTAYATCTRKDLLDAFKDIYGDNFKEIVKDEKSLDKFLKVDLMSQIEK